MLVGVDFNGNGVYTDSGEAITYDNIGNPTNYFGNILTWFGRQLTSFEKDVAVEVPITPDDSEETTEPTSEETTEPTSENPEDSPEASTEPTTEPTTEIQYQRKKATFKYDADGLRSKKVFDGVTTEYQYIDGKLYYEGRSDGTKLYFFYDSFGDLTYIYYHKGSVKEKYAVVTNKRGDVVYIFSFDGATKLASFGYDAWGNVVSVTDTSTTGIASINPIRYRGYYYDTDLDLYYLQSRYYNPTIGRFLNADNQLNSDMLGCNTFAYCGNNPVNCVDPAGHAFMFLTAAIGAVAGAVAGGIYAAKKGENVLAGAAVGAAVGGIIGLGVGAAAGVMLAGSATATTTAVASGAGMLATSVSTSGIGAGVMLVADNISRSANNVGTVLYSGGEQARQAAEIYANRTGGTTIDQTIIGQIANAAANMPNANFTSVWSQASSCFCNQANGVVNAFVSNSAYRGIDSIFWSVEMPTLLNNPRISEVIIHIFE